MKKVFNLKLLFIITGIFFGVFLVKENLLAGERNLVYEYYDEKKPAEVVERHYVQITNLPAGEKLFKRKIEYADFIREEEFVSGVDCRTKSWKASCSDEGTGYAGEKKNNELFIKGRLKGKNIDEKITLDEKPFYWTPKFSLSEFALSDLKRIEFWMLHKDTLKKCLMQAEKMGEESIIVRGREVEVIKIYYSAAGMKKKFYRRVYYFRKSDGLFLRRENPDSPQATALLISETCTP